MNRRSFLSLLVGAAAYQATKPIYVLPPPFGWSVSPGEALFFLPEKSWSYSYKYKNSITGLTSDVSYLNAAINIYRQNAVVGWKS